MVEVATAIIYLPKTNISFFVRQDLVSKLTPDNPTVNIGVLQVAHSIFKRWRPLFQSNELYNEINHVLNKFGQPFLTLFEVT